MIVTHPILKLYAEIISEFLYVRFIDCSLMSSDQSFSCIHEENEHKKKKWAFDLASRNKQWGEFIPRFLIATGEKIR